MSKILLNREERFHRARLHCGGLGAVQGNAGALVQSDRHLLPGRSHGNCVRLLQRTSQAVGSV